MVCCTGEKMKILKNYVNLIRFSHALRKNRKKGSEENLTELVNIALIEKGLLYKLLQNIVPEKLQNLPIESVDKKFINNKQVIAIIESELKISFDQKFSHISEPLFSASIGQVHRATLREKISDVQDVAIKIQFPEVDKAIFSQLKFLKVLSLSSKFSPINKWRINLNAHLHQIELKLKQELDYTNELNNIIKARSIGINAPLVFAEYSSSQVISQEWLKGVDLQEVKNKWNFEERKNIANILVNDFMAQLFAFKFYQADTNFSNFLFTSSSVHWIDYGNWCHVSNDVSNSLYSIIFQSIHGSDINYLGHLEKIGFDIEKMHFFKPLIPNLISLIFEPFLENRPYDLSSWNVEKRISQMLGENKWWFRSSGGTIFFEIMKSFFGILKIIQFLEVNVNWQSAFLKQSPHYDIPQIEKSIKLFPDASPVRSVLAKNVIILVLKNNYEHVKVELPSSAFFNIEEMIPDDAKLILKNLNVNIAEMKSQYLKKGLIPGEFYSFEEKNPNSGIITKYIITLT